jgi:hypothetical protein
MMPALIALLTGVALGMRFKFLILVPAIISGALVVASLGAAHADSLASIACTIITVSAGLQLGYLGGLMSLQATAVFRAARLRKALPQRRHAVSRHAH